MFAIYRGFTVCETNIFSHLEINGWQTILSFGAKGLISGENIVRFRDCIRDFLWSTRTIAVHGSSDINSRPFVSALLTSANFKEETQQLAANNTMKCDELWDMKQFQTARNGSNEFFCLSSLFLSSNLSYAFWHHLEGISSPHISSGWGCKRCALLLMSFQQLETECRVSCKKPGVLWWKQNNQTGQYTPWN